MIIYYYVQLFMNNKDHFTKSNNVACLLSLIYSHVPCVALSILRVNGHHTLITSDVNDVSYMPINQP